MYNTSKTMNKSEIDSTNTTATEKSNSSEHSEGSWKKSCDESHLKDISKDPNPNGHVKKANNGSGSGSDSDASKDEDITFKSEDHVFKSRRGRDLFL